MTEFQETETVELKKSTSELKEAMISIVAMLNKHQRGEVWFGVKNDGTVAGQQVSEKTMRDVSKSISEHIEPRIYPVVEQVTVDGKPCIKVQVEGREHSYYAYGRAYKRKSYELTKPAGFGESSVKTTQKTNQKTTQKILELIANNPNISRVELATKIGIYVDGIKYQMNKMRKDGVIKRVGPDKGGYWEVVNNSA